MKTIQRKNGQYVGSYESGDICACNGILVVLELCDSLSSCEDSWCLGHNDKTPHWCDSDVHNSRGDLLGIIPLEDLL